MKLHTDVYYATNQPRAKRSFRDPSGSHLGRGWLVDVLISLMGECFSYFIRITGNPGWADFKMQQYK